MKADAMDESDDKDDEPNNKTNAVIVCDINVLEQCVTAVAQSNPVTEFTTRHQSKLSGEETSISSKEDNCGGAEKE